MNLRAKKLSIALNVALGAGMVAGVAAYPVMAQTTEARPGERIEITGSRVKRAEAEGALPVTVIERAELEASGSTTVAEYIRSISFATAGNFRPQSGSSAQGFSEVNLRGLGGRRTLVLVDGRRIAKSPIVGDSVDMNSIPLAAVERIEILTDGASAIYGSDAIGGVVNVILRKSFQGVDNGPVEIRSTQNIVAAERVIYKVGGSNTSFTELMALPDNQLDNTYWLPWYNNVGLDSQLRFANVSSSTTTVDVYIQGVQMIGSPFTLAPGESIRQSFAGIDDGPVQVVSNVPIVAAERVIYRVNGMNTSFSEIMGLPDSQLDTTYRLPWYNNIGLDSQLRFGVP